MSAIVFKLQYYASLFCQYTVSILFATIDIIIAPSLNRSISSAIEEVLSILILKHPVSQITSPQKSKTIANDWKKYRYFLMKFFKILCKFIFEHASNIEQTLIVKY